MLYEVITGSLASDSESVAIAEHGEETAADGASEGKRERKAANGAAVSEEIRAFADRLCEGRDARDVLAAALSIQYGESLSPEQYNEIKPFRSHGEDRAHVRLYIGLGRRDGMTRRGIRITSYNVCYTKLLRIPSGLRGR